MGFLGGSVRSFWFTTIAASLFSRIPKTRPKCGASTRYRHRLLCEQGQRDGNSDQRDDRGAKRHSSEAGRSAPVGGRAAPGSAAAADAVALGEDVLRRQRRRFRSVKM